MSGKVASEGAPSLQFRSRDVLVLFIPFGSFLGANARLYIDTKVRVFNALER